MPAEQSSIAVLGSGSWGTALAIQMARAGGPTSLWGRDQGVMQAIQARRCNEGYLPGIALPDSLQVSADLEQVVKGANDILVVVPSHAFRDMLKQIKPLLRGGQRLVWATKGFENGSGQLLSQVVSEILPEVPASAVVSGPTFAKEVAQGLPTAMTVASTDPEFANQIAARMRSDTFRPYTSEDVIGVQVGGAVKNVLAIAAGIADGLGFGANTRAALITRGLAEIMRLGKALGGRAETFMGLAGLGDLVLTCTDNQSRNRRMGLAIGQGKSVEQGKAEIKQVVEGVQTAREVHQLAVRCGVDMPITEQVYRVLFEAEPPQQAVAMLLSREQKAETL